MQAFNFVVDNLTLQGWLHLPQSPGPNLVIGSHGLLSIGNSTKQIALAEALNARGIAYIRFDHRGVGLSAGCFASETTLANRTRDLLAVHAFARVNFDLGSKLGLFGSSMGGATCLNAFDELQPQALVTVAAPITSADILQRQRHSLMKSGTDENIPGLPDRDCQQLLENANKNFDLQPKLADINHVLVIHGANDEIVPCAQGRMLFAAAQEPKKLLLQTGGDHIISDPRQQTEFLQAASDWFCEYL